MFAGKTVVITGASSGLGAALAEGVAKAGGSLALLARNAERLGAVAESCRAAGARVVEILPSVDAFLEGLHGPPIALLGVGQGVDELEAPLPKSSFLVREWT